MTWPVYIHHQNPLFYQRWPELNSWITNFFNWLTDNLFCTLFLDVTKATPSRIDRRSIASAFYWHEVEEEIRERGLTKTFVLQGRSDEELNNLLLKLEHIREDELYVHNVEDCSPSCQMKGNGTLQSFKFGAVAHPLWTDNIRKKTFNPKQAGGGGGGGAGFS